MSDQQRPSRGIRIDMEAAQCPSARCAMGAAATGTGDPRASLWDLIDPELAALAMASLYGTDAQRQIRQMAQACTEAARDRDSAFWQATLAAFEQAGLHERA